MNRISYQTLLLIALSVILVVPGVVFPDEATEVWAKVYKHAPSLQQKYAVMLNIVELDNRDVISLLIEALDDLNNQSIELDKKEIVIQNDLKSLIVNELGDLKASEAGPYIYRTVKEAEDPFLKGEAISALGKTGAKVYTRNIALILKNLTLYRGDDLRGEEAIAFGCIVALERLKEPEGYAPVFYALNDGFSRRIKKIAKRALLNIMEDPSEILKDILINESKLNIKLNALKAENNSNAPAEKKINIAYAALEQGLNVKPPDIKGRTYLRELRMLALEMFSGNKADDSEIVPSIEKVLYMDSNFGEKMNAIEALRVMSNDDAAKAMNRFLAHQNSRQGSGVTASNNRLVIATIRAIGNANSNVGTHELLMAKYLDYPASVVREADKAIKALE